MSEIIDLRDRYPHTYAYRPLTAIDKTVVHHSAVAVKYAVPGLPSMDDEIAHIDAIYRHHTQTRGWPGIAYHYAIAPMWGGWAYRLTDMNVITYHARAANATGVGVVFLGKYDDPVGEEWGGALISAFDIVQEDIARQLMGRRLPVFGHQEVMTEPTECPGTLTSLIKEGELGEFRELRDKTWALAAEWDAAGEHDRAQSLRALAVLGKPGEDNLQWASTGIAGIMALLWKAARG